MRELRQRAEPILKIICLLLAVVVVYQLAGIVLRWNPFRGVTVPELPSLVGSTNSPAGGGHGTNSVGLATIKGTNGAQHLVGTNTATAAAGAKTNSTVQKMLAQKGTNAMAHGENRADLETNVLILTTAAGTNVASLAINTATNSMAQVALEMTNTNAETNVVARLETKLSGTNSAPATNSAEHGTNLLISTTAAETNSETPVTIADTNAISPPMPAEKGTNSTAHAEPLKTDTNVVARLETKLSGTNSAASTNVAENGTNILRHSKSEKRSASSNPAPDMAGMNFNPFQPPGKSNVELPPAMKSRISKITDSEILGPVMHPLPMALLGIAGEFAFLRSANGQTGLVKPGDSLDDIKLLRIGINRVLIEQSGQKKELMIFSGYGGDSLLPTNTPDENNHP